MSGNLPPTLRDIFSENESIEPRNGHISVTRLGKLFVGKVGNIQGSYYILDETAQPAETYPVIFSREPGPDDEFIVSKVNAYNIHIKVTPMR